MTWTFAVYCLFLLACLWIVARKSQTILNPVTYYALFFGVQTLVAPVLLLRLGLINMHDVRESDLSATVWICALYFGCVSVAFMVQISPLTAPLRFLLPRQALQVTTAVKLAGYLQSVLLFVILMYASGAGTMWFTNPRLAYQTCRDGAGVWWSLCQGSLIVSFGCALYRCRRSAAAVWSLAAIFGFLAYFLGSKGFVLGYVVLGTFYIQHCVQPIKSRTLIILGATAVVGVMALQLVQGTAATVLDTLEYFDYFTNSSMFVSDFSRLFGYQYGQAMLSDLWYYVPRFLYPAKPYLYGVNQIMAVYYPGAAEIGSTPGVLPWTMSYWDFGLVGVILNGLMTGFVAKAAFNLFRGCRSLWTFLLFAQVGLICGPLAFYNAPFPLFILWIAAQWMLFYFGTVFSKLLSFASLPEAAAAT